MNFKKMNLKRKNKLIKLLIVFSIFIILISKFTDFISANPNASYYDFIPVVTYHHIVETQEECINDVIVTAKEFENHLAAYVENGYVTIFLDDLYDILKSNKRFNQKYLVITFDDGYLSNYIYAYPLLEKYGLCANISLVSTSIGQVESPLPMLSWNEINEMEMSGLVRFYSHGYEHVDYSTYPIYDAVSDLQKAEDILNENLIIHSNKILSYPHGGFDRYLTKKLKKNNFVMAITTRKGFVNKNTSLFNIPRININPGLDGNEVIKKISDI